ncbi:MAG: hypothetical protein K8S54_15180 [Spirochaetia bacterium]|nr:hypothetical protein [Spirochaetia bacterium]
MRRLLYGIIFLAGLLGITACGLLNPDKKEEDNNLTLLLILAALRGSGSGSTCSNQSGLVICIPPGVPL